MPPAAAASSIFRYYFTTFTLLIAFLQTPSAASSFSIKGFRKDSIFESDIALLGDAKVVDVNGSSVAQLTELKRFSVGRLAFRKPFKLLEGSPSKLVAFSTYFSFSLSGESGDGLAFLMASNWSAFEEFDGSSFGISQMLNESRIKALAVELDSSNDVKDGDLNGNHVGFDVGSLASVKTSNGSSVKLVLNSGEKLSCWIDYEASSKRMEVRLSRFSAQRPVKPLLMHSIDFARNWNGSREFYMGLSSSNGNSTQTCFIYSWSFTQRFAPKWMHSQPMDPSVETDSASRVPKSRSHCVMRVLAALIFGAACGVLGAYMVMLMWRIFANRRPVTPEDLVADPSQFKMIAVGNKAIKDGQK
ncbi:unnamed protein product [Rhodiola kirilowii]